MTIVLVSGASGIVGYGILRSLRKAAPNIRLIGTSIYTDSVAPAFCDIFELAPRTSDQRYLDWLLATIRHHKVDMLIPGIEDDMYLWSEHVPEIRLAGALPLLNTPDLIRLCKDKWAFFEALRDAGVSCAIESSLESDYDLLAHAFGVPFIVKPRRGFGSKGVVSIGGPEAFEQIRGDVGGKLIVQPLVGADDAEYTVSAFCDGKGGMYACMALRRRLSKEGFTEQAEVTSVRPFTAAILELCGLFRPEGPTNFQFRQTDFGPKLLEINPRVSSSTAIRTAFGYNECGMALDYHFANRSPIQPEIRPGKAIRYTDEFIFYENSFHF